MEPTVAPTSVSPLPPQAVAPILNEVEPETVASWLANGDALLVDVREGDEYADERIPGALLLPFSTFTAASFPRVPCKKVVLVCLTGKRSLKAGTRLAEAGITSAYVLKGGMLEWLAAGQTTISAAA